MQQGGYRWAALELDDFGNALRWPEFRVACLSRGVKPGVWVTDGWNLPKTPADALFTIAELESEGDYLGILQTPTPQVPHAVITNFTPLTDGQGVPLPDKAKPLIERGYVCITECDLPANQHATPDQLNFRAHQLGWSSSQPAFYTYGGFSLDHYSQWHDRPGWSIYLGEYVL